MNIKNSWLTRSPIAHRGLHNNETAENSLSAFKLAIDCGFPIELDVRLTDDDVLIIFHDDTLKRMTGADGYVTNLNSSDLENYRLAGTDDIIPTFEKTLELIAGRVPVLIEIKNSGKVGVLESKLADMLADYNGACAIQSFNPYSLEYFKHKSPDIPRGQLACFFTKEEQSSWIRRRILSQLKMNKLSKPDFIAFRAEDLPNKFVTRASLPVLAWTIRSNAEYEKVRTVADNIIFERFIPKTEENNTD